MVNIKIKPLSVNQVWQGRRFKTQKYKDYEKEVLFILPKIDIPSPPYSIYYEFGFSSPLSDLDNPIKPLQDILQKKYGIDDKHIHHMEASKRMVKKGDEYIKFSIKHFDIKK